MFTVRFVSELKNTLVTNLKAIRGSRQPIRNEIQATERGGVDEICDAATSIKQTIKSTQQTM